MATTVLSPVLFLLFLEIALRVLGFGGDHPLFVAAPDMPGHLQANEQVMRRYFPTRAPKVSPDVIYFRERKLRDTYRIVVQGGSTAAGFPYGRWAGLAGMLGDRLEATFPDRQVEVISTAMAAVNSYTLLDFAEEIAEIEPDAVLIYAGHNEYLGVLGAGSALTGARARGVTLLNLRLRKLRIHQFLQLIAATGRAWLAPSEGGAGRDDTLMARAAGAALIPFGSPMYDRGVHQLEENLRLILETYRRAGIRVYLGTLASNESGQPPFAGDGAEGADAEDSASAWWARARAERANGDLVGARTAFRNAKDRDALRFRAPEDFNLVIRHLAEAYEATLVDVQGHLAAASPDGIIGNDLMLEHVHPNARGYFLLADAYYQALERAGAIGDWSAAPDRAAAERDMPITALDRVLADYAVRELKADFPFTATKQEVVLPEPRNELERLARRLYRDEIRWIDAMDALLRLYRDAGRLGEAVVPARLAAQAYPELQAPNHAAGILYLELRQPARARRYLNRSLLADPSHVPTLQALIRANLALGDRAQARAHLAELGRIAPTHPLVLRQSLE